MTKYDLMPGDIVRLRFANNTTTIIRVYEILDHGVAFLNRGKQFATFSTVEPIKLTPEILEKNGWKKEDVYGIHTQWVSEDGRCIATTEYTNQKKWGVHFDSKGYSTIGHFECDNMHELQQALRICGMQETANKLRV